AGECNALVAVHDEARDIRDREHLCAGEAARHARPQEGAGDRREHTAGRPANPDPGAAGWRALRAGGRAASLGSVQATGRGHDLRIPRAGPAALARAQRRRALGALPSPLWGGVGGVGHEIDAPPFAIRTPLPSPPPQEGRKKTEFAARADPTSHEYALARHANECARQFGLRNLSTNSSTGPVGRLTEKSRASSGWRRKSPSATSLKPAASTSRRSKPSSMRWSVFPTVAPSPARAEWSAITSMPPGLSAA